MEGVHQNNNRSDSGPFQKERKVPFICFYCKAHPDKAAKRTNHKIVDCPVAPKCGSCGKKGHTTEACKSGSKFEKKRRDRDNAVEERLRRVAQMPSSEIIASEIVQHNKPNLGAKVFTEGDSTEFAPVEAEQPLHALPVPPNTPQAPVPTQPVFPNAISYFWPRPKQTAFVPKIGWFLSGLLSYWITRHQFFGKIYSKVINFFIKRYIPFIPASWVDQWHFYPFLIAYMVWRNLLRCRVSIPFISEEVPIVMRLDCTKIDQHNVNTIPPHLIAPTIQLLNADKFTRTDVESNLDFKHADATPYLCTPVIGTYSERPDNMIEVTTSSLRARIIYLLNRYRGDVLSLPEPFVCSGESASQALNPNISDIKATLFEKFERTNFFVRASGATASDRATSLQQLFSNSDAGFMSMFALADREWRRSGLLDF